MLLVRDIMYCKPGKGPTHGREVRRHVEAR
jgi:hypothetical protein